MATKNYLCRFVPPGFGTGTNKDWFKSSTSWTQGSTILPGFSYSPSAEIYTYPDVTFMYGYSGDGIYQFVQFESGVPSFAPYHQHYFIGSLQGPVMDGSNHDIVQQADMLIYKDHDGIHFYPNSVNAVLPNMPGKSAKYAIKNEFNYSFRKLFKKNTFNSEGIEYVNDDVPSSPTSAYPIAGVSSWYSAGGTYEKEIMCVSDGILGLYFPRTAVETGNQYAIASDPISADAKYYGVIGPCYEGDISGNPIGAFQVPYYKVPQSIGGGKFVQEWGSDVDSVSYENTAFTSFAKYVLGYAVYPMIVKTEIVAATSELYDRIDYYIFTPIIYNAAAGNTFNYKPICKKITADDIDTGSNMEFLVGKYLVWTAAKSTPMLCSEVPEEEGWSETLAEADYSKSSPMFTAGITYPIQHFVNTSDVSGKSSHVYCDGAQMYMTYLPAAKFKTSGTETLWTQLAEDVQDAYYSGDSYGLFGGSSTAKLKVYQVTGTMYTTGSSTWEYPTDVQCCIVKSEYDKDLHGYQQKSFAVNWTDMPVIATETGTPSGSPDDPLRLHELEIDYSDLGLDHPQDGKYGFRIAWRLRHPDPAIGFIPGYLDTKYFFDNQGTLPYCYRINPLQLINPIGLESISASNTMLKGYYRAELKDETTTTKDIFISNGESLGTFTYTGSPSAGTFKFTLADVKCHCIPYHDDYGCKATAKLSVDTDHKHMLLIIHKGTGQYYAGGTAAGGAGNSLWQMKEYWITSPVGSYSTYTDANDMIQYQSSWTDWNIKDRKKNSGYYIILTDLVPCVTLSTRGQTYGLKICTLAKWDVDIEGTATKIYDISTDGLID